MTYDEKLSICRLRIEGKSVAAIAKEVGFSNQAVFGFLQKLPHVERDVHIRPNWSSKFILSLCADYLSGNSISMLAEQYKMDEAEVLDIFSYLVEKRPSSIHNSMYPELTNWIRLNGYSLKAFALELGVTPNRLARVCSGKGHMRYELAKKIQEFTNLPFSLIYATVIEADKSASTAAEPPAKRKNGKKGVKKGE